MSVAQPLAAPRWRATPWLWLWLWLLPLCATALVPWMTDSVFHFHVAIMICVAAMATGGCR